MRIPSSGLYLVSHDYGGPFIDIERGSSFWVKAQLMLHVSLSQMGTSFAPQRPDHSLRGALPLSQPKAPKLRKEFDPTCVDDLNKVLGAPLSPRKKILRFLSNILLRTTTQSGPGQTLTKGGIIRNLPGS